MTSVSDMLNKSKGGTKSSNFGGKSGKGDRKTQFVEWNFQKRDRRAKRDRLRKDHPSFNIFMKLLDKLKNGKEIKESMPAKSVARYLFAIYMAKAADLASDKQTQQFI
mmetsp:Transcript_24110/g.32326  ORF Transcript_24110/g.32326 Transcript_24110/m.32326 type:complete len:108 (-) Transcript_24110:1346-1669(-)